MLLHKSKKKYKFDSLKSTRKLLLFQNFMFLIANQKKKKIIIPTEFQQESKSICMLIRAKMWIFCVKSSTLRCSLTDATWSFPYIFPIKRLLFFSNNTVEDSNFKNLNLRIDEILVCTQPVLESHVTLQKYKIFYAIRCNSKAKYI